MPRCRHWKKWAILWIVARGFLLPGAAADAVAERSPEASARPSPVQHWAFRPIPAVAPPLDERGPEAAPGHPVDRFVRARLAARQLHLNAPADRRLLIRRASFDLLGLPPSAAEVDAFVHDPRPDAFDHLVERLLASPHYGERWGRWWLDVARYADTNGQDENKVMANAWRYRDWVIRSCNANQPFDEFTRDQLAGDLLPTNGIPERTKFDRWTATGLLVLGPKMLAEQDKPKLVMDIIDEQIDVVTRAFLGLTVGCARCHDHKFDPIPTRDYYALAGIFKSTRTMENLSFVSKFNERLISTPDELAAITANAQALAARTNELQAVVRDANAALVQQRRRDLVRCLTDEAELRVQPLGSPTPASGTNGLARLKAQVGVDLAAEGIFRRLESLVASPAKTVAFVSELESGGERSSSLVVGRVGGGFRADGTNYLELAQAPALEPAELTMETWVRVESFPAGGDTRRWLINKNGNEWVEGHYALLLDRSRAGACLNIGGGREDAFFLWSGGAALKTNQWHHLAATYDGALLKLYVDGVLAGTNAVRRPRIAGALPLALGRRQDGYVAFRGRLDEARIFNRALAVEELKDHFEHPEHPVAQNVVARWEFNELTDSERQSLDFLELRETLSNPGPAGFLALPKVPAVAYPAATRERIRSLESTLEQLRTKAPPPAGYALAVAEEHPVDLPVHLRGSHLNLASNTVPRGFLQVVSPASTAPLPADQSGRLELARWLTAPENPLTARVIVNRVWQAHFGEGLVRTSDNFGVRGEPPTHPELLDWLASRFLRTGWDIKALHRLILTSATWQQSSVGDPAAVQADPDNRLLSRFPRQRLEAEMVRDALLAVSGRLDPVSGGSIVNWKNDEYAPRTEDAAQSVRRSIYLPVVRDLVYDVFTIFDFANPSVGTSRRIPTVVSHQALFFLNSPLVKSCSLTLADNLLLEPMGDDAARLRLAYRWTLNRLPTESEVARSLRFMDQVRGESPRPSERAVWSSFCQTLLAGNEFVYRD